MFSSVLKSKKAIQVNIQIMRAFTKLKSVLVNYGHDEVKQAIKALIEKTEKHDEEIYRIYDIIGSRPQKFYINSRIK